MSHSRVEYHTPMIQIYVMEQGCEEHAWEMGPPKQALQHSSAVAQVHWRNNQNSEH